MTDLPVLKIEDQRLAQQIAFVMEMDKLKAVERMTKITCLDRFENDAEHSWHVAIMALVFEKYAAADVNIERVVKMLLIHDVVEIDAGDTYIYGDSDPQEQFEKELAAAKRIFGLLPTEQADELLALWQEFEARESADAKFAKAIDRLSPFIYYGFTSDGRWVEQGVNDQMVREQMACVAEASPILGQLVELLIETYKAFGTLRDVKSPDVAPVLRTDELTAHMHQLVFVDPELSQNIHFIMEMDKLKTIIRQTQLVSVDRLENDAEHSWNLAVMAVVLQEYANTQIDLLRVLKMLIVHDVVEIDAGDAPLHDPAAQVGKEEKEIAAAVRLFGMVPEPIGPELHSLWQEFEAHETGDAQFGRSMDRLSPLLYNFYTKGERWSKFGVTGEIVKNRLVVIDDGATKLWNLAESVIEQAVENGFIK